MGFNSGFKGLKYNTLQYPEEILDSIKKRKNEKRNYKTTN